MARKFVTGGDNNVVSTVKRQAIEVPCQGNCGRTVTVMTGSSNFGILCPECSKSSSFSLKVED